MVKAQTSYQKYAMSEKVTQSIFLKLGKCVKKYATLTHQKMATRMESLLVRFCCKNENEIGFLIVTLSWGYQHGFSAETSQFHGSTTSFYDCVANNFIKF